MLDLYLIDKLIFQIRYVNYFQELKKNKMETLPSRPLLVKAINITGTDGALK